MAPVTGAPRLLRSRVKLTRSSTPLTEATTFRAHSWNASGLGAIYGGQRLVPAIPRQAPAVSRSSRHDSLWRARTSH